MSLIGTISNAAKAYNKVKDAYTGAVENLSASTTNLTNLGGSEDKYPTFSTANVKSTVTNPSAKYKGISKEDEARIEELVNKYYGGATEIEKQQARQGLYKSALEAQKDKDIQAGRQEIKLDYINKAQNAKSSKEKNTYMSEVKKSDLADLIKQHYSDMGYDTKSLNLTDDGIIAGFVEANPIYEDIINKYFYSKDDAIKLGKDLGWIKKTNMDKVGDKVGGFFTNVAGWIPKFGEGVADLLNLAGGEKESAGFENFVQEKYGTAIANLTDKDLAKAKEAYANANKKEYEPNLASAGTKLAEGTTDILFTAGGLKGAGLLKNNMFKAGFAAASETPILNNVPELLGTTLGEIGGLVNKIPGFSKIRDSLQTDQEKADWDAFVGGNVLALFKGTKNKIKDAKNIDIQGIKDSRDKIKQGEISEGINTLEKNAESNRVKKINEEKQLKAQDITQGDINTRAREAAGLDYLDEQGKLKGIKSKAEFDKVLDDEIKKLREEQTTAAGKDTKRYGVDDIYNEKEVPVLDEKGNKTTTTTQVKDFAKLLDKIIEHYEETDSSKATTFKSYKQALEKGQLPMDIALEIKREGNTLGQNTFTKKSQIQKNSEKAEAWGEMMDNVNKAFDNLDMGEDIRSRDARLSQLYSIKNNLVEVERRAADLEKKAVKKTLSETFVGKVGNVVGKFINKISFGLSSLGTKGIVALLSGMLGDLKLSEKTSYTAAEIKAKIPEFIKDYRELNKKIENKNLSKSKLKQALQAWIDKRESTAIYNDEE